MELREILLKLGTALALGLLVGLQRERADTRVAGVRTFPLITLLGAVAALAAPSLGTWLVAAGFLALAAMLVISNVVKLREHHHDPGITTEVAALLMYGVGAYLVVGYTTVAALVGGAIVLLLHLKQPLHRFVDAMGERDVAAIMQFVLITCIILPLLPDRTFGPYDVLNPRKIWWMVVLIVSISLGGYVAFKFFGARAGALLGGVLGGLISSTATTVSYARRTSDTATPDRETRDANDDDDDDDEKHEVVRTASGLAALVIVVASAVSFARVMVEVAVVAPQQFRAIGPPLGAMLLWMVALSAGAYYVGRGDGGGKLPEAKNPAELKPALIFGALYGLVILAVAFVKQRFGDAGLYPVAVVSGLTDMDAITLSTANLARAGRLDVATTWRLILVAALSNLVFKGAAAVVLGSADLRKRIVVFFGLALAGGVAILLMWPW